MVRGHDRILSDESRFSAICPAGDGDDTVQHCTPVHPFGSTTAFLVTLMLCVLTACTPPSGEVPDNSSRFKAFVESHFSPPFQKGDEGDSFIHLTARGDSLRYAKARTSLDQLRSIDTTDLALDEQIDWLLLEASLLRTLKDSLLREGERIPGRYITLGSIEWRVGGDRTADERAWRDVLQTLQAAPTALALGVMRLQDPPKLWVDLAAGTIARHDRYLGGPFRELVAARAPVGMRDSLAEESEKTRQALESYRLFLRDSVRSGPDGSWAVGEAYYSWLLRQYHFLPYDAEALIREGMKVHADTKKQLEGLAERSGTGKTWQVLVEEMKEQHPAPYKITDAYIQESNRAQALIRSTKMIDIPPAETLLFVPTPPALRETYAWGGYGGIALKDSIMTGRFFVTDIDSQMSAGDVTEKLRTQNTGWITVISLHEGYPGHHLQGVYARLNPQKVRARLGSSYFGEGWALYCESWMAKSGFYVDRWDSLGWLNMRLWRTARVIIDPSLHTGRMTYDEAVTFFMDEVGLERSAAEAEVNRYTTWPAQAPSYIIGWLEIERLRETLQRKYDTSFSDKEFAESMLRTGSLPPVLLGRAVREAWEKRQKRMLNSYGTSSQGRE